MINSEISNPADQLKILPCGGGRSAIVYLGYPLYLSRDEFRLLSVLLRTAPIDADPEGYLSSETILTALQELGTSLSTSRIVLLTSRINRKASVIGGRKLIQGKSHHGYRINPRL